MVRKKRFERGWHYPKRGIKNSEPGAISLILNNIDMIGCYWIRNKNINGVRSFILIHAVYPKGEDYAREKII